jgi:hypothetical protein
MENGKFVLELTHSQQMALIDLISGSLRCRCDGRVEEYVDCSQQPSVVTTPGQLLRLVSEAKPVPNGENARQTA